MAELVLHARSVETVFDLLGHDENNMTAALGWALARSPELLRGFVDQAAPVRPSSTRPSPNYSATMPRMAAPPTSSSARPSST